MNTEQNRAAYRRVLNPLKTSFTLADRVVRVLDAIVLAPVPSMNHRRTPTLPGSFAERPSVHRAVFFVLYRKNGAEISYSSAGCVLGSITNIENKRRLQRRHALSMDSLLLDV